MIAFPFSNAFAMDRAKKGNQGEYMALYSIAFSIAHIFGHNAGMRLVDKLGFDNTWYIVTILAGLCVFLLFILSEYLNSKKKIKQA
jgi:predicted MFS family arabinose efflux permease